MPENLDPGLKPYLLEFSGASVDSIYRAIEHTIASIDKMANTGAVRATESKTMSGVAMETEFQLLNARLSEKADNLELAEEQMWKLWCEFMGYEWNGHIEYPGSFNIRDTAQEITHLQQAKAAATNPKVFGLIDGKIAEFLGEDPEVFFATDMIAGEEALPAEPVFEAHIMVDPDSGTEYIARTEQEHLDYAALGYIHKDDVK